MSQLRILIVLAGLVLAAGAATASGEPSTPDSSCPDGSKPVQEGDTWTCPNKDTAQSGTNQTHTGAGSGNATSPPPTCEEGTFGPEWDDEGGYWYCYTEGAGPDHNTWMDPNDPPTCPEGELGPEWEPEGGYWYCYTESPDGHHTDHGNVSHGDPVDTSGNHSGHESQEQVPGSGPAATDVPGAGHDSASRDGSVNNSTGRNATGTAAAGRTPGPGVLLLVAGLGAAAFALRRK